MNYSTGVMFLIFLLLAFSGQEIRDNNPNYNINNISETIQFNTTFEYYTKGNVTQEQHTSNIIFKTIDYIGTVTFELVNMAIKFGFNHPEYNELFENLFIYYIIAIIIIASFPPLILIFALSYLLVIGIKNIFNWIKIKAYKTKWEK